ncbi:MAG: diguanylate cyclase [Actinobacteria bacterium]|nr:diguanylate cyclase [Actinomycetota bacterium]
MSAIPSELALGRGPRSRDGRKTRLSTPARAYLIAIALAAAAVAIPVLSRLQHEQQPVRLWATFLLLATATALAQVLLVKTPRNQSYHATNVFLVPAVLLLPPELVALVAIVQHIPAWLKNRTAWYIESFNISNYILATLAAWGSARLVLRGDELVANGELRFALAGCAASLVLVGLNHALLAPMLMLARGHSIKDSGLFSFHSLSTELVLAALGVVLATFWNLNPWLIPFAIAPVLLIHRSLSVPQLKAEARVDPKTGLFNARHFGVALAEEIARASRFDRPFALLMADLDLLRDINNSYGHLAGDAVLKGIAETFRLELRHYDVPARFGGEEFSILLPETDTEEALEIAERIRAAVAARAIDVETSSQPIRVTISLGVATFPRDGGDANELIHQADLAVYRAKLQGRNRVLDASSEPLAVPVDRKPRLVAVPQAGNHTTPLPPAVEAIPPEERRHPRAHVVHGPSFLQSRPLAAVVSLVTAVGIGAGAFGLAFGSNQHFFALVALVVLVGLGEALALEVDDGSISVSAVGALAGAALFGPRAALPLAVTTAAVHWSARRYPGHYVLFNIGSLCLASLAAAGVFALGFEGPLGEFVTAAAGLAAGLTYFAVNTGLTSLAMAMEGHQRWWAAWHERFAWLAPHWVVYGFVGGVMAIAYHAAGLYALAVFAVPLLLMRRTQETYLRHTQKSAQKLREAAETIQTQNVSLERANKLLKERSTAAMESLSATVDARDAYTAGHSRRVQQLALAIGSKLGLSRGELDLLGHAALFHDIGKLAVPDAILLKPAVLTEEEWTLMQRHSDEGARIIDRLGFLNDAVPAIRHHHERFDGTGYPDALKGEEIPLGARIIHVADALDSMLTTRIYRAARPALEAMDELKKAAGTQFCPRCVDALEGVLPPEILADEQARLDLAAAAS